MLDATILENYFDRLWPILRSITGYGFTKSLDILSELIPLQKHYWNSGDSAHDWIIPDEWNIYSAVIEPKNDPSRYVIQLRDNNLHVVGYSEPISGVLPWKELRRHVYTVPELPDAIPFITSFYKRSWGFCMSQNQYDRLEEYPEARYYFNIDSALEPGQLVVGDYLLKGETDKEILLSSYLCHPTANDGLSGVLVLAAVYNKLKDLKLRHTIRFVVCPENIGSVAYLSRFGPDIKLNTVAGYVVTCVGLGDEYTYKESRQGDSLADRAAKNILWAKTLHSDAEVEIFEFFPDGGDERQYCSPGYSLPVGTLMRRGYWRFPEYHTSKDCKELISFDTITETAEVLTDMVLTADRNTTYKSSVQFGTPFFSKTEKGNALYSPTMKLNSFYRGEGHRQAMLEIVNWSGGEHDLLWIADRYNRKMLDILPIVDMLVEAGYLIETQAEF